MNGTLDELCRKDLMDAVVARLPDTWTMHWLEHADHGLKVLKRSGRTHEDVLAEVAGMTCAWLEEPGARRSG
jgi:predicted alpha/beta-hydrolase family hydrolase